MNPGQLTIRHAQQYQPWTVPYQPDVSGNRERLAAHTVLHIMKSAGKLADIFEQHDHDGQDLMGYQLETIRAMAADLITCGIRLGNLYEFDVAEEFIKRTREKNGSSAADYFDQSHGYELKYGAITTENGSLLSGEPVFLLRSTDPLSRDTIGDYLARARHAGCSEEFCWSVGKAIARMTDWQIENPGLVKERPD